MHASWFRKPVYKIARIIAILTFLGCGILILLFPLYWYCLIFITVFWITFFMAASFKINSGLYLKAVCVGKTDNRKIAITFDDGPSENTSALIDLLAKHNVKASFFLVGEKAEKHIEIVKKMTDANHTIGNHSQNHRFYFPIMSVKKIIRNIASAQEVIKQINGTEPIYFRPPFGVTNPLISRALNNFNLIVVGWSVRSFDTIKKNPDKILDRIKKRMKPGSIILLHDSSKNAVPLLQGLLLYCKQQNLWPVSLDEFLTEI